MILEYGCYICDKWIPSGVFTGLLDIEGKEIYTGDWVNLSGCTSKKAIIGKNDSGFRLYFGSLEGSVGWDLDEDVVAKHKIRVL
ncbi:hypothetical protein ACEE21_14590 [Clostridium baratii]